MTPYEALNGEKPNISHMRTFGCLSHVHIPQDERDKIDPKSKKCILMGYGDNIKGYRLYDLSSKKIIHSRDVIFDESLTVSSQKMTPSVMIQLVIHRISLTVSSQKESSSEPKPAMIEFSVPDEENVPNEEDADEDPVTDYESCDESENSQPLRRSSRERKAPNYLGEWVNITEELPEPTTVKEALEGPERSEWKKAIDNELQNMKINSVWSLVDKPEKENIIKSRWIFKRKLGPDGQVSSYKARLVARGFTQQYGLQYDETFSPVVRFESVRSLIALAVKNDMKIHQMDVSCAFLNGDLSETIYMSPPEGIKLDHDNLVCKLNKAIYGLKQASKCWNNCIDTYLRKLGFRPSSSDSCLYVRVKDNVLCIIAVYVDDLIIASKCLDQINELKSSLSSNYRMKDLGELRYFLGVNVVQGNDKIVIHQSPYTKALLNRFNFENANPVSTPVDVSTVLEPRSDEDISFDTELYQSAVGSLLYLCTKTRPDIAFAVCNVAKYSSKPNCKHWTAVKRIFRYLRGTCDQGIVYDKSMTKECVGYSDADWAGDRSDRKSTSGYCFTFGSGLISWRTNKQTCVALSTAESEYVALSAATQQSVWLQQLLGDIGIKSNCPMTIFEDNQSAICLAKNQGDHPKSKHIDIKYHYVRDMVKHNKIVLEYCNTNNMLADIFTKALSPQKFINLRNKIGMISINRNI